MKIANAKEAADYLLRASLPCKDKTLACFILRKDLELDELILHDPNDEARTLVEKIFLGRDSNSAWGVLLVNFAGRSRFNADHDSLLKELRLAFEETTFELLS